MQIRNSFRSIISRYCLLHMTCLQFNLGQNMHICIECLTRSTFYFTFTTSDDNYDNKCNVSMFGSMEINIERKTWMKLKISSFAFLQPSQQQHSEKVLYDVVAHVKCNGYKKSNSNIVTGRTKNRRKGDLGRGEQGREKEMRKLHVS